MKSNWLIKSKAPQGFLEQFPALPGVILQLLWNRNLATKEAIQGFFVPEFPAGARDPFLFSGMREAVDRIDRALEQRERIAVFGDFDTDGVCGVVILFDTLRMLGGQVMVYIPDRIEEGHGVSRKSIEELADQDVSLMITVDCGVSNVEEVAFAKEKGIDVIVSDHHLVSRSLPPAVAVLDAKRSDDKYPFKWLCGAGMAWKIAQAVAASAMPQKYGAKFGIDELRGFLDLAAIATIADMVPLLDENRLLVRLGLAELKHTRREGLLALLRIAANGDKKQADARFVSFSLVPRINAASRLDHANTAFRLLTARSKGEAAMLAELLDKKNTERQQLVERISAEVTARVRADVVPSIIIAGDENWSLGVLGVVANKTMDALGRPAFLFWQDVKRGVFRGSARAPKGIDLVAAMSECGKDMFVEFGGHAQAAGATVREEHFSDFKIAFENAISRQSERGGSAGQLEIEAELGPQEISVKLALKIEEFAPFGEGNPVPRFLVRNLEIGSLRRVGNGEKHTQFSFLAHGESRNYLFPAIMFNHTEEIAQWRTGDRVDIICELLFDEWQGRRELKLKIVDAERNG